MSRVSPRFIPACAGNRCILGIPLVISPVHPRVCGEQQKPQPMLTAISGSSPRVRGTDDKIPNRNPLCRFIPACAGNRIAEAKGVYLKTVHPRVCGKQSRNPVEFSPENGSSPRVRGTGLWPISLSPQVRFIPACAGNRRSCSIVAGALAVHPRVCGEQRLNLLQSLKDAGSSPRVRGTVETLRERDALRRFIPACAGNRMISPTNGDPPPVHPRVCGEQRMSRIGNSPIDGSSPRVRGTELTPQQTQICQRFIPACAGNRILGIPTWGGITGSSPRVRGTGLETETHGRLVRFIPACAGNSCKRVRVFCFRSVHPRVCGEQRYSLVLFNRGRGSSPRVRGTGHAPGRDPVQRRFIPACAGNSGIPLTKNSALAVHPRVCGEQPDVLIRTRTSCGSSPRVRGTVNDSTGTADNGRFIPACAGNSRHLLPVMPLAPVHPRVCGEQSKRRIRITSPRGSSPRVRGTGKARFQRRVPRRFIPACAGNRPGRLSCATIQSVHPRVCGEQALATCCHPGRAGSSPRVRGTGREESIRDQRHAVHPRVCGEQEYLR